MSIEELRRAAQCLSDGGVVAHATEGVWGFACLATHDSAILQILAVKQREPEQGLLLIGAHADVFAPELAALEDDAHRQAVMQSWPGPHTWVLPNVRYSKLVVGAHKGVACRVPGHEQARALCALVGVPVVSTSANRSGQPSCITYSEAFETFADEVDMVLQGAVDDPGQPSSIYALDGTPLRGATVKPGSGAS